MLRSLEPRAERAATPTSELRIAQDNVCSHKHKAREAPYEHKHNPEGVPERGEVLVNCPAAKDQLSVLPTAVRQESRNEILDPVPSIGSRDPHQRLQVMGAESHQHWRNQRDGRKDNPIHHPRVGPPFSVEKGLPVVAQGDCDDGEVGADGEDGEEAQEVANEGNVDDLAVGEVERVHVHEGVIAEAVNGSEGQEAVESQDQDVIEEHELVDMLLLGDGCDEGWQGVLAHEGVDAHPKEIADARQLGHGRVTFSLASADADQRQNNHEDESWRERRFQVKPRSVLPPTLLPLAPAPQEHLLISGEGGTSRARCTGINQELLSVLVSRAGNGLGTAFGRHLPPASGLQGLTLPPQQSAVALGASEITRQHGCLSPLPQGPQSPDASATHLD